ncbi:MAG: hypothetical protein RDU25_00980 [Patescibacteria group bacterium]|nr:hypothetical protein [Patescibacteria group bacterium]
MPTNLARFAVECIPEIESRLGAKLVHAQGVGFKTEHLDPVRYFSLCPALKKLLPEGVSCSAFDIQDPSEISPAHFVSLIEGCYGKIDKEHVAKCPDCTESVRRLASAMFSILDGADSDDALGSLTEEGVAESMTIMRVYIGGTGDARQTRWANLMLDPRYVATAARALDGLTPEQGKETLATAFQLVTDLPEPPELWSFELLMNSSRLLVVERPDK